MENITKRFLKYIAVDTRSDETKKNIIKPTSEGQIELGKILKNELNDLTGKDLNEADAFRKKIKKLKINKEDKETLLKSVDRLELIPEMSPDYG
ncbi:MAG: endopeptidase La, partial [Anaerococcus sp.]|nr:endopeptidase La [Anaerococcus sp.]